MTTATMHHDNDRSRSRDLLHVFKDNLLNSIFGLRHLRLLSEIFAIYFKTLKA